METFCIDAFSHHQTGTHSQSGANGRYEIGSLVFVPFGIGRIGQGVARGGSSCWRGLGLGLTSNNWFVQDLGFGQREGRLLIHKTCHIKRFYNPDGGVRVGLLIKSNNNRPPFGL